MPTTTEFIQGLATTMSLNGIATIDSGQTATLAIPNSGRAVVRLGFPATMTGTTVTFTAQAYPRSGDLAAASFRPVVDKDGNAVSYACQDDSIVAIPELSGCAAFTIVSGSAEGAARSIEISCRGDNPVVQPLEVDVNIEGSATVTANQGTPGATPWPVVEEPIATSGAASSQYAPVTSVVTAAVIKATPGNVFHIFATNANAAVRYLQLHNKATIPLATEVPLQSWIIPAGTALAPGYVEITSKYALAFSTGIGFAISSTQGTFTDAATAGEHTKLVEYA